MSGEAAAFCWFVNSPLIWRRSMAVFSAFTANQQCEHKGDRNEMTPTNIKPHGAHLIDAPDFEPTATDRAVVELTIAAAGFVRRNRRIRQRLVSPARIQYQDPASKTLRLPWDVWRGSF